MSEQIAGAEADLEHRIANLRQIGEVGAIPNAEAQLQVLSRLRRRLDHASPSALAALRAEVVSLVAATQLFSSPSSAAANPREALERADTAARQASQDFMRSYFEDRAFDPYLHFDSRQERDAYVAREAEREAAIRKAQAQGTPQGDLTALRLEIDQLKDAGAHGAAASPDYAPTLHSLSEAEGQLADAAARSDKTHAPKPTDPLDALVGDKIDPALLASLRTVTVTDPAHRGPATTGQAVLADMAASRG